MHKKYNTQNFVKGLKPFISSLPQGIKKNLKKRGYNFTSIVDNWSKIVGEKISNDCYPTKIKVGKSLKSGVLIINVAHGKEIDVEYKKREIIDKINSFFGYKYVEKINLNLIPNEKKQIIVNDLKKASKNNFNSSINKINNIGLKNLLNKLIKAYNGKNI